MRRESRNPVLAASSSSVGAAAGAFSSSVFRALKYLAGGRRALGEQGFEDLFLDRRGQFGGVGLAGDPRAQLLELVGGPDRLGRVEVAGPQVRREQGVACRGAGPVFVGAREQDACGVEVVACLEIADGAGALQELGGVLVREPPCGDAARVLRQEGVPCNEVRRGVGDLPQLVEDFDGQLVGERVLGGTGREETVVPGAAAGLFQANVQQDGSDGGVGRLGGKVFGEVLRDGHEVRRSRATGPPATRGARGRDRARVLRRSVLEGILRCSWDRA